VSLCGSTLQLCILVGRDEHAVKAGVASIISMTIGLLALAACIILVILLVRCVACITHYH